jgi:hypothetical protein
MQFPQAQKAVNNAAATTVAATISSETPNTTAYIIVTGIHAAVVAAAAAAGIVQWVLRDGPTGTGTIRATGFLSAPVQDTAQVELTNLEIPMTPGNVATLEFTAAAAGASSQESVTLIYKVSNQLG